MILKKEKTSQWLGVYFLVSLFFLITFPLFFQERLSHGISSSGFPGNHRTSDFPPTYFPPPFPSQQPTAQEVFAAQNAHLDPYTNSLHSFQATQVRPFFLKKRVLEKCTIFDELYLSLFFFAQIRVLFHGKYMDGNYSLKHLFCLCVSMKQKKLPFDMFFFSFVKTTQFDFVFFLISYCSGFFLQH